MQQMKNDLFEASSPYTDIQLELGSIFILFLATCNREILNICLFLKDILLLAIKFKALDRSIKIKAFDRSHGFADHILRTEKCQTLLP